MKTDTSNVAKCLAISFQVNQKPWTKNVLSAVYTGKLHSNIIREVTLANII